jgi:hypothetical protein
MLMRPFATAEETGRPRDGAAFEASVGRHLGAQRGAAAQLLPASQEADQRSRDVWMHCVL